MDFDLIGTLIAAGFICWIVSYASKSLFVDKSDAKNPFRTMVVVLGWVGIALVIWGLVIFIAQLELG